MLPIMLCLSPEESSLVSFSIIASWRILRISSSLARSNGVVPSLSSVLGSAPFSNNSFTHAKIKVYEIIKAYFNRVCTYRIHKYSDFRMWHLISVYTVCHSSSIFQTQHWVVNRTCSNFRTSMVRNWGVWKLRVNTISYIDSVLLYLPYILG